MTFSDLPGMLEELTGLFAARIPLTQRPADGYARMRWPKLLPLMKFSVKEYAAPGWGNVFSMATNAMGGKMRLATLVLTPNLGAGVPLLLVDVMAMGKKRAAFVEYYDCTAQGAPASALRRAAAEFRPLPDYPEKSAWYVSERAPYSLIKGGSDDDALLRMLEGSLRAYAEDCAQAVPGGAGNLAGLETFIDRMVREGNPSSAALTRVLGKSGAEIFFRTAVMPAVYQPANG